MTLRRWYALVYGGLAALLALALAGCYGETPSGPTVDARGNTGTITTNITTGSSSPVGTAPCGATSSQKAGENTPAGADCSTVTPAPVVVTP